MATLTFKGGVHPYDGKELSKDKAIVPYQPKGDLIYPVSQHIGAPAAPVVAKGDRVLVGQKIAEAGGFVSSPVYASVSGTVKAIEPHFVSTGAKVNSIVVENDGLYEEAPGLSIKPFEEMSREDIIECLWDNESFIDDNTLTVNITRLRTKLEEIGLKELLETKRGQGYLLKKGEN